MRWQSVAVAIGLAAPPVLLAAAVWPDSSEAGAVGGGEIEDELGAGDSAEGRTNGVSSTDYLIVGEGVLRVAVQGLAFDATLTFVDAQTGDQLDYNDDFDGLDPQLTVELDEGESVRAQVRSLSGPPGGAFTIRVDEGDGGGAPPREDPGATTVPVPAPPATAPAPLLPDEPSP